MTRVLLLGAGGCAARGVANSLRLAGGYELYGADPSDAALFFPGTIVPCESDDELLAAITDYEIEVVHAQPEQEVDRLSRLRRQIRDLGCQVFLPRADVIAKCRDKYATAEAFRACKVPHPDTALGCHELWPSAKTLHLRPRVGSGGKGSLQTSDRDLAAKWIKGRERDFTVAEAKSGPTVTWQAVYADGYLKASQQRRRLAWTHGDRGSALISETYSDLEHEKCAMEAVRAVDLLPHGIYGVDMVLDEDGRPFVTEINIGRFFTTIEFFAQLGLNMPDMAMRLALRQPVEAVGRNPLPNDRQWHRSLDAEPILL